MKKIIFFICLFVLLFTNTKATHLMGGDITYLNLGSDSFEVTVTIYRDCNGIPISNSPLEVSTGSGSANYTLQLISVKDITGVNPNCPQSSKCSGSYQYGIEEHIYKANVKLFASSSCEYTFSWQQCCRNSNITTGAANELFYIHTTYNKCLAPNNSSPSFLSFPVIFMGVGNDISVSHTAIDTVDNDFFSYELINPLKGSSSQIGYSGSFTKDRPLTFLGYPNTALGYPAGFRFDTLSCNMSFRPTQVNQITVVTVKVKEWRIISGVPQIISETIRDLHLIVINAGGNKAPKIDKINSSSVFSSCGIGNYCITIPVEDADANDTLSIEVKHNLKNVTVSQTVIQPNKVDVKICYTIDSTMFTNSGSYYFKIIATDNFCPSTAKAEKTYTFRRDSATPPTLPQVPPVCETAAPITLISNPNYGTWSGAGVSANIFSPSVATKGWHYLYYDFNDSISGCHTYDSIRVRVVQQPKASFTTNNHTGLSIDTFKFTNTTTADTAFVSTWNMGQSGAIGNIQTTPNASHVYHDSGMFIVSLIVSNFNICPADTATDTVTVSFPLSVNALQKNSVKIYPNPANDKIFIEVEEEVIAIEIFDINGKVVYSTKPQRGGVVSANVSGLSNGAYLIKITLLSGEQLTGKISILH